MILGRSGNHFSGILWSLNFHQAKIYLNSNLNLILSLEDESLSQPMALNHLIYLFHNSHFSRDHITLTELSCFLELHLSILKRMLSSLANF